MAAAGTSSQNTLSLWDRCSGRSYLVDTGADVSVFPVSFSDKCSITPSSSLQAANGTPIMTWGQKSLTLSFGKNRKFCHSFYIADVTQPILGADFFITNNLAIDLRGRQLVDLHRQRFMDAMSVKLVPIVAGLSITNANKFSAILEDFPEILIPRFDSPINKHGVEHFIITEGPPLHARARRLDAEKFVVAREEFANMEKLGIIRRSNSPWASPLHVVPKPNGGLAAITVD
jgi:cleavage and polyadenylation specificity factor subunit 1